MTEIDARQRILEGALQVFSTEGFHKASIKKIAKAADIKSSALIYHYFDDKKALLNAVVQELSPMRDFPFLKTELQGQLMGMPPELLLSQIATGIITLFEDESLRNLMRLFFAEAIRMPEVAENFIDTQYTVLQFLMRFFEHQVNIGVFREQNVEVTARAFIGMILINILARVVFIPLSEGLPDKETYVNEIVRLFLSGVRSEA